MIDYTKYNTKSSSKTGYVDKGLRSYMIGIYNYMGLAMLITAFSSYLTLNTTFLFQLMFGSGIGIFISLAPIGIAFYLFSSIISMPIERARILFVVYSFLMGMSLSYIFAIYTHESIARTFLITASLFGTMSIYGYTTDKDLTSVGSFLFMGLIGIILASLVNLFLQSSALMFAVSVVGVIVFTGLIAYDTQKLKALYYQLGGGELAKKYSVVGALSLYLDFINLFISLLRLMGDRR